MKTPRVGIGYDVHRLVQGRPLILGGVRIEHDTGLLGHSDADVLAHAVTDALLGAAALGDIGRHFPDTDAAFKNADSMELLTRAVVVIREHGFEPGNVDATVIAQAPRLAPHIETMRERLADAIGLPISRVNVKATTEEGLGFTGLKQGIAAQAIALVFEATP